MAYDQTVQSKQCANLLNVLNRSEFTDVTFLVGNNEQKTSFKANRLFLASISPVFKAMMYGQMQESKPDAEIEINDIEPNAFKSVLKFSYCNNPELTPDNIIPVRIIADKYQILSLSELCDKYFSSCLNAQNICLLLSKSLRMKLDVYQKECVKSIKSTLAASANEIVNSTGFLAMNKEALILFLQMDDICIKEENLWEAVLKWLDNQPEDPYQDFNGEPPSNKKQKLNNKNTNKKISNNKLNLLKMLCPYIRFGLMNTEYFVRNVRPLKCLTGDEVADIVCYMQCNDQGCGKFVVKPRRDIIQILKFSDRFKSNDGFVISDDRKCVKRISTGHKYILAGQPVSNGKHCWRVQVTNNKKWIMFGVAEPKIHSDSSYLSSYGISGSTQYWTNTNSKVSHNSVSTSWAHSAKEIDILLDIDKGNLNICPVGNCNLNTEAKLWGLLNTHSYVPAFNIHGSQIELRLAKIPVAWYGKKQTLKFQ